MEAALVRNARIRDEGTRNLVRAAKAAGVKKIIAQSIAFVYAPDAPLLDFAEPAYGETARAVHSLEQQITADPAFIGIVLCYGWLYGAGTGFDTPVDFAPPVHAEAAAHAAVLALQCEQSGIYNAADDDARLSSEKAKRELGFDAGFRL
ncbi:NAD(P)-dependent oxidoreductase [Kingella bonacorsii]|uniref:NAD(P)-dependent oxidoreductase n=1 Tax=Kingella bonacorsii TaxID=2796361 RepID=A0ABS1BSB1_9NEIS|nr:NAD(P)-dependent oxidoreductase [Kingella bonacorsii]MBK0396165.1 NAD(P)-dependent oxidoreductase [Kingella bonacorsii]